MNNLLWNNQMCTKQSEARTEKALRFLLLCQNIMEVVWLSEVTMLWRSQISLHG